MVENDEKSDDFYTRKNSLRLQGFDYASQRVYFVTINVQNRRPLFFNREFAREVIECLLALREREKFKLYCYCLMPDIFTLLSASVNRKKI